MTLKLSFGVTTLLLSVSAPAAAEAPAAQRAAAEAMFQQATQLMDQRRFAEACEKLAASQELDPALGTMLYLADCYDRAGRSASAWALFREVEQRARRAEQPDRERIARERAAVLEGQLSRLELRVPAARQVPGLELFSAGVAVPKASWNTSLPVDPGSVRIEARAPGRKPWTVTIKVAAGGARQVVELPELPRAPAAPEPSKPAPGASRDSSSAQGTWAIVLGGVGVVALAAGGYFGYRAYSRNKESRGQCRTDLPNACTEAGAALRQDASDAARLSTILGVGGAVVLAGGVTLALTAPSTSRDAHASSGPVQLPTGASLQLGGVW